MDVFDYCWEIPSFSLKSKQWGEGPPNKKKKKMQFSLAPLGVAKVKNVHKEIFSCLPLSREREREREEKVLLTFEALRRKEPNIDQAHRGRGQYLAFGSSKAYTGVQSHNGKT